MEDLIKPHFPDMAESKATLLSKGLGQLLSRSLSLSYTREEFVVVICCGVFPSAGLWLGMSGDGLPRFRHGICAAGNNIFA